MNNNQENPPLPNDEIKQKINTNLNLRILSWNAQSISAHAAELKLYIEENAEKPHVICIQESWLRDDTKFNIKGYNIEMKNRTNRIGGGVATFIKCGISYEIIKNIPDDIEGLSIRIKTNNSELTITNLYIPPKITVDQDALQQIMSVKNVVICGDLNAKNPGWGSPEKDTRGDLVGDILENLNLTILNTGCGTRINNDGSYSHLDIAFASSNLSAKSNWSVIDDCWGSDHLPTLIKINEPPTQENIANRKFNFKKADWAKFKVICKETIQEELIDSDINASCDRLSNAIIEAAGKFIPKTTVGTKRMLPYWNTDCKNAVKQKRTARGKMNKTFKLEDCIQYRKYKADCQRTIRNARKTHWQEYCSSINSDTKINTIWKTLKNMSGVRSNFQIPNIREGDKTHLTNKDKADAFARSIAHGSSDANLPSDLRARRIELQQNELRNTEHSSLDERINDPFEKHELFSALRQCKKNTSPGDDEISYAMIKNMPKSSLSAILKLFNEVWKSGVVPTTWKHSIVVPILKPNKESSQTASYRPISLTSTLCKLNERIVANRLSWFIESNRLFNRDQSGFRKSRSTIDHILRLQSDVTKSIHQRQLTAGIFLDFTKAFDMLWIEGLLFKLKKLRVEGHMFKWIRSFLTSRTIQVKVGNSHSEKLTLENGTPQGSVISPLLFLLMINDIPDLNQDTRKAIFADDCAIWKSGRDIDQVIKELQVDLNKIHSWCNKWGFLLSKEKTMAIIFGRVNKIAQRQFVIDGSTLKWEKQVKFLGMIFDENLTWKAHIDYVVGRCKQRLNLMRCISGNSWGANKTSLLHIYRATIRSIIDYGSAAYNSAHPYVKSKLDQIQAQALRIACGAMRCTSISSIQVECGEMPLQLRREEIALKYALKIEAEEDHPAKAILLNKGRKIKRKQITFYKETKEFLHSLPSKVPQRKIDTSPPWHTKQPAICTVLRNLINKNMSPDEISATSIDHMNGFLNFFTIISHDRQMLHSD